jgi:hypothetical protein
MLLNAFNVPRPGSSMVVEVVQNVLEEAAMEEEVKEKEDAVMEEEVKEKESAVMDEEVK